MKSKRPSHPVEPWITAPISPVCENLLQTLISSAGRTYVFCGLPTDYAYKASGGGWCGLCEGHAAKLRESKAGQKHVLHINRLICEGEMFDNPTVFRP